jgi:hypothetical protein
MEACLGRQASSVKLQVRERRPRRRFDRHNPGSQPHVDTTPLRENNTYIPILFVLTWHNQCREKSQKSHYIHEQRKCSPQTQVHT